MRKYSQPYLRQGERVVNDCTTGDGRGSVLEASAEVCGVEVADVDKVKL